MSNLYGNARIKDIDEYMDRRTQSKIDDQNDSLELPRKLKNKNRHSGSVFELRQQKDVFLQKETSSNTLMRSRSMMPEENTKNMF